MDIISFNEASTANGRIEKFIENPDSSSGIITTPKTIASGETVTIPAGRVAILPNVQIDGVLNVEGEVFIPSGATLGDLDAQLALKADTSYVNTQLSFKANTADLKEIGVGQTWQDVTASRALSTTYTNTTGKPIMIKVWSGGANSTSTTLTINSIIIDSYSVNTSNGALAKIDGLIPAGATYSVAMSPAVSKWFELR